MWKGRMFIKFNHVFSDTENDPIEFGQRWTTSFEQHSFCQNYSFIQMHWTHCTLPALTGISFSDEWEFIDVSHHSPWWTDRLYIMNIWRMCCKGIWHPISHVCKNRQLVFTFFSLSCLHLYFRCHPIDTMQPSCVFPFLLYCVYCV